MPPKKKQRTGKNSSAAMKEHEEEQPNEPTQPNEEGDPGSETAPVLIEESEDESDDSGPKHRDECSLMRWDMDKTHESYSKGFTEEKKAGVVLEPAKDHPDHKWCIMWEGWKMFMDYRRRANYCDPDNFGMYIYNDFPGWGHQELIQNFIVEFDKMIKKSDEDALKHAWAVVSAMGLWLNEVDQMHLIGNEDGEGTVAVLGLVGWATIRALAALDFAGHLKPDTEFPDIPIVVTSLLEFSKDLPEYGIEDEAITWRPHAATYFKKGKFADEKGITDTKKILETAKGGSEAQLAKKTDKDPWGWDKMLKDYKSSMV
ncbi:hypothetical protein E8E13_009240 [Curvularia kusanoi]|uniref:Uncharacterized protein n=1 Tax=Curvularia kusanoi TaxID=90978 RepID=A0A9P4WDR0_CURKU|nr:hypothetical protein E8E13_009240 [Curvularia kusanoi]